MIFGIVLAASSVLPDPALAGPTADFDCSLPFCNVYPGHPIEFRASSNAAQPDYEWDLNNDGVFGDQTGATATQTFAAPGTYPISLQVTDTATKQSVAVTHNVTVRTTATFTCQATPSCDAIPVGSSVALSATSDVTSPTYSWEFDDGADGFVVAGPDVTHTFANVGSYLISLRVTGSGGQVAAAVRLVTVVPTLDAEFGCTPSCDVAAGTNVTFAAKSDGHAPIYGWNYGSDFTFDGPTAFRHVGSTWSQRFSTPGRYVIALTVTDGGQSVKAYQSVTVSPFNQRLRIPRVLTPGRLSSKDRERCDRYRNAFVRRSCETVARQTLVIHMREASVQLVPGQTTRMWTFDGTFPGPTIRAQSGQTLRIQYINDLPRAAGPMTIHLHGDHHPSADDGQPDSDLIYPGGSRTYTYPLTEDGQPERAAFRFYHDHRMGETGRDVWNGLAGMFILDDRLDSSLDLPTGNRDVPLMVSDRKFTPSNQLAYSSGSRPPVDGAIGDHVLVNGTFRPFLNVGEGLYRFRLLNASNWCSYNFELVDQNQNVVPFLQIGTDGGLTPRRRDRDTILLGPAERADVLVDFMHFGDDVYLKSVPRTGSSGTDACRAVDDTGSPGPIMVFRVTGNGNPYPRLPDMLRPLPSWTAAVWGHGDKVRADHTFHLRLGNDSRGTHWTIDGRMYDPRRVDAIVRLGTTTYWNFVNDSPVTHYMHIHDNECVGGNRSFSGTAPEDRVLKDTFRVDPHSTTRIACRFTDYLGLYMIHCHMLEHEDNAMMAQFLVVRRTATLRQIQLAISGVSRTATRRLQAATLLLKRAGYSWARVNKALWLLCHLGAHETSS